MPPQVRNRHGVLRGLDKATGSPQFEGRFGRMFRTLPAARFPDGTLEKLAAKMSAENEDTQTPETSLDDEENYGIPAGFTYLGQFIDHDITFDPASSLQKSNDPESLIDFRTPRLDLDSLYGRGPDDEPYMYEPDGKRFVLGKELSIGNRKGGGNRDLPRAANGRAIIGDKRNDENVIVSQLHGLFMRFHNLIATQKVNESLRFDDIQQIVRWHYQWIVLFDFLPRIVGRPMVEKLLPHLKKGAPVHEVPPALHYFHWRNDPFMPVEFSVAAYRFGHSMVRPVYRLSARNFKTVGPPPKGLDGRKFIFSTVEQDGLNGFKPVDSELGIDFALFFETHGRKLATHALGAKRVQPSYKIDTSLVGPLSALPEFSRAGSTKPKDPNSPNILALRNLKRGAALGLPSGQDVARFMGLKPIDDDDLLVGKAVPDALKGKNRNKSIVEVDASFTDNAPLWFYILAEAQHDWVVAGRGKSALARKKTPTRLGKVGGRIVAEVLIGLLWGDSFSFLNADAEWRPTFGRKNAASLFERFTMADLVELIQG